MRDCSRRREVGIVPAEGIQPVATENSEMKTVVNRREVVNSLLCPTAKKTEGKKRTSPKTPKEKKRRVKKDRRGFSKKPSFAWAGARVGAANGHAGRVTLPDATGRVPPGLSRRIARALDVDLELAVAAFGGTAEDRRIWAAIAWRVGVDEFHYAVMDKLAEDAADGAPRKAAAAFQAFLNRRFPKGGAA